MRTAPCRAGRTCSRGSYLADPVGALRASAAGSEDPEARVGRGAGGAGGANHRPAPRALGRNQRPKPQATERPRPRLGVTIPGSPA